MKSVYDNYPAVKYVDEVERDESEECKHCVGGCGYIGMIGEWACKGFRQKKVMTNREKLIEVFGSTPLFRGGCDVETDIWLESEYKEPSK